MDKPQNLKKWQHRLHEIIYEADTPAGKLFDVVLLFVILASILIVLLESVKSINADYSDTFDVLEWVITILFSLEYIARIICVQKPFRYIFSFYGIIDLLSTIPKYLSLFFAGAHSLAALRGLRLLRVFRILKITRYVGASTNLTSALIASRAKIVVFLFAVLIISIIVGTLMYLVEGEEAGFSSIPRSIYWCIVTLTTVGFGDIAPQTPLGQLIASFLMILGYGIIAVPTGIVSAEYSKSGPSGKNALDATNLVTQSCTNCLAETNKRNAKYCWKCGSALEAISENQSV